MTPSTLFSSPNATEAFYGLALLLMCTAATLLLALRFSTKPRVMLLDFACFKPPQRMLLTKEHTIQRLRDLGAWSEEDIEFQKTILDKSGLGDATAFPDAFMAAKSAADLEAISYADKLAETEEVLFTTVQDLLAKTGVQPEEIDIVITSCSCFAPTPSMAAMLLNRFRMRKETRTYSLAGMGCASSLVCVDMAKQLLTALPNQTCLIVNHENIISNVYTGKDRTMLVTNALFRVGGAAALLTSRPRDAAKAKYDLRTTLRTQMGAEDEAFQCMGEGEDAEGRRGIFLKKTVIPTAGRGLHANLTALAPCVLPLSEQIKHYLDKQHPLNLGAAFDHFLLHTGGKGVLDAIQGPLGLSDKDMAPARGTLSRFGNTSAASTWYILAHIEHFSGVRRGDVAWQLGFGGGFKCNSAVWRARKTIHASHACWD